MFNKIFCSKTLSVALPIGVYCCFLFSILSNLQLSKFSSFTCVGIQIIVSVFVFFIGKKDNIFVSNNYANTRFGYFWSSYTASTLVFAIIVISILCFA